LLQIMEEGRLTDSFGRHIDFRNVVLIMTSNIGANLIKNSAGLGFAKSAAGNQEKMREMIQAEVERHFRPEFINRLDEIVVFNQLARDDMQRIVENELAKVGDRLAPRELVLETGQDVLDWMIEHNFNADFGARPLKRAVERHLEDPLSEEILRGHLDGPHKIFAYMDDGKIAFRSEKFAPGTQEQPANAGGSGDDAGESGDEAPTS
ncbi:MAG: ATP-dependent Clp protease ATP-binding subunit, partial [Planctomycetes bacterium]|nr:ATP-dependent Clp protease ATP-binding subunit [Planctomycetota bacterium]